MPAPSAMPYEKDTKGPANSTDALTTDQSKITDHAWLRSVVAKGKCTSDHVRNRVLLMRFPEEIGKKFSYSTRTKYVLEPSPYGDQTRICREHKRLAIPLRDARLDEALLAFLAFLIFPIKV